MSEVDDPYNLRRFVDAQEPVYRQALAELAAGAKRGHWIWFIFPQLKGLGHTAMADHFGIGSRAEARAYLAHPVLGPRLRECARLLAGLPGRPSIQSIAGSTDALKICSSMTLFLEACPASADSPEFQAVLDRYYGGKADSLTLGMLGRA